MPQNDSFIDFVKDQLGGLRNFEMKRMFGGRGLYLNGVFFGILNDGKLYFKTSESSLAQYQSAGVEPFFYYKKDKSGKKKKLSLKRYYEVPLDILENRIQLKCWAEQAAHEVPFNK